MSGKRVDLIEQEAIEQVKAARKEVNKLTSDVLKLMDTSKSKKINFIDVDSPKKLEEALLAIAESLNGLKGGTDKVTKALTVQEKAEKTLAIAIDKRLNVQRQTTKELIENRGAINRSNAEMRKQDRIVNALDKTYQKLNSKYDQLNKKAREAGAVFGVQSKEFKKASKAALHYRKRIDGIDNTLKNGQRNVGRYNTALGSTGKLFRQLVSALGITAGITAIFSILKDGVKTILEFNRQLIAVGKTTDLSKKQLASFGNQAVTLGLQLKGISTKNLLKSAEVAGQLGIRGTKNILKFSATLEKLGLTSDIIGQESARNFAKFIEVSSDSVENADRLGSVITELGNNFATTEGEILKNTTEIQKGLAIYETSAQSVIALGAATSALGGHAEASRGALQKTFKVLNEGASSGKNLEKILKLTGQTAAEFKEEFGRDAVSVFNKFVKGLSESSEAGNNLSNTLADLGLNEKRTEAVVGSLAKNYDTLKDALSRANTEYETNVALNKEYNAATEALTSHIGDMSDAWDNFVLNVSKGDGAISTFFKNSVRDFTQFIGMIDKLNETESDKSQREYNEALERGIKLQEKSLKERKNAAKGDGLTGDALDLSMNDSATEDLIAYQRSIKNLEQANDKYNESIRETKKRLEDINDIIERNATSATGPNSLGALKNEELILKAKIESGQQDLRQLGYLKGREEVLKRVLGITEIITGNEAETARTLEDINKDITKAKEDQLKSQTNAEFKAYGERIKILEKEKEKIVGFSKDKKKAIDVENQFRAESVGWLKQIIAYNNQLHDQATDQATRTQLREENKLLQEKVDLMSGKIKMADFIDTRIEPDEVFDFNTFETAFKALTKRAYGSMKFDMEELMAEYKKLYGEDLSNFSDFMEKKFEKVKGFSQDTIDIIRSAQDLLYQGTDLGYALIDRRIQKIEEERDVITERYDEEIAKLDEISEKKNLSEIERLAIEKRKKILEKEKDKAEKKKNEEIGKEKTKQAKLDKANAIVQAIINTAVAVAGAGNPILAVLYAAIGAASIATIIAQPIPKYKKGKKSTDRYEGLAMVNDATISGRVVQEFREDKHGNISAYSGKNILTHVAKDDIIYKNLDSLMEAHTPEEIMKKAYNASVITSLELNKNKDLIGKYEAQKVLNQNLSNEKFKNDVKGILKGWKFHHHTDNSQLAETIADLKDANDFRDSLM